MTDIEAHISPGMSRDIMADRARELMVLNAIAAAVAQSLEPQPLLTSALDHVLDLLELDAGAIYTHEDGQLRLIAHRGFAAELVASYTVLPVDLPVIGSIVAERQPLMIADLRATPELVSIATDAGLHALLGLPLFARSDVVGILLVFRSSIAGFSTREKTLLEAIADHIALALDNARLFAAEQTRRRQAEALRKGALALTEALGLDAVLRRIVHQAVELMETPMCAIYERDPTSAQLTIRSAHGLPSPEDTSIPVGQCIVRSAIEVHHAVSVSDVQDVAWLQSVELADQAHINLPFRSVLAAPLLIQGRVYGGIVVFAPELRRFTRGEIELIDIFADQAALALEHARLVDQSRQLAALEERQRIARDLHDSVSQTLFSLSLAAQAARTTMEVDPHTAATTLEMVQELASGALAEMRALIFELRPGALREAGLAAAIQRFADAFRSRTGIVVTLDLDSRRLPADVEEALYRITGEALANVGKHACASSASVTLRQDGGLATLIVQDNGVGFDPRQPITGDHMGQRTMQERAAVLGGSCTVLSERGAGTSVIVNVPIGQGE